MSDSIFDRLRRGASPVELELTEAYAKGQISRRAFVQRGSVIGLSMAFMGTVIAACGSSSKTSPATAAGVTTTAGGTATTAGGSSTTAGGTAITTAGTGTATTAASRAIKPGGTLRIAAQTPSGPLDPVAMADLGTYTPVTTCFEYLVDALGGELKPMLAESWKPNADGSVWTFVLRKGVKWHDGSAFTSADVVATMDRLAGSNLKASIAAGSTKAVDDFTVQITLLSPDGQFPQQVGAYNPQSVIISKKFWDTLSGAEKKIVLEAAAEAVKVQRQTSRDAAGSTLDQLKKVGMQVTELPPAEIAKLRDKMRPVIAKYSVSVGQETVKAMQDELAKIRK